MRLLLPALLPVFFTITADAQNISGDRISSFALLNQQRIKTNQKGMIVLGSWAAANIITGTTGYFIATGDEWKSFHAMNAIWNVANGVIAVGGYMGARKELAESGSFDRQLQRYEASKRIYLINGGLDLLYIGTGAFLMEHGRQEKDPAAWTGLGRSIVLQGAFLLLFDGVMYVSHQQRDKNWYKLLNGLCVSGNGIGIRYEL